MTTYFRVQDELGNFADKYSFAEVDGEWWYFSHTGYPMGCVLHGSRESAELLLKYLVHKSSKLGFSKKFTVVEVDESDLNFDNRIKTEKIDLLRVASQKYN